MKDRRNFRSHLQAQKKKFQRQVEKCTLGRGEISFLRGVPANPPCRRVLSENREETGRESAVSAISGGGSLTRGPTTVLRRIN